MADIRSYIKEKEKREKKRGDYKEKIAKHKQVVWFRILLTAGVLAVMVIFTVIQYKRHVYTGYDVIDSVGRETVSGATDLRLGNAILTYSKDGAHCTNSKGNINWNQTFEIQDVMYVVNRNTMALGDYNGRSIYLADTEKLFGEITTTMPIQNLTVSENGRVAVVLADTNVTWINIYDSNGEHVFEGQAHMDDSGYPIAISLSPNGQMLCVSYVYLDAGVMKTEVAFYNFGLVGSNVSDFLVSSFSYPDLVPCVGFLDDNTAFAVGDGRLVVFSGGHKPTQEMQRLYEREIQSVYYSDRYIGLVFLSDDTEHRYRLDVYDKSSGGMDSFYFDVEYTDIFFEKNDFVAYNETDCQIITMDGIEKYNGSFSKAVRLMLPTESAYRYILVTDQEMETIQLK